MASLETGDITWEEAGEGETEENMEEEKRELRETKDEKKGKVGKRKRGMKEGEMGREEEKLKT